MFRALCSGYASSGRVDITVLVGLCFFLELEGLFQVHADVGRYQFLEVVGQRSSYVICCWPGSTAVARGHSQFLAMWPSTKVSPTSNPLTSVSDF